MKLAWICYMFQDGSSNKDYGKAIIVFEEPDPYRWDKVVPIVYAEIVDE